MKGLSPRNLRYMRDFALAYPHFPFLQAPLANLPDDNRQQRVSPILQGELAKLTWYHHITLIDKVKELKTREFYILQTIQYGWSRDVMVHHIEAGLHKSQGQLSHNFDETTDQSELVVQVFKDPYKFDFIYLGREAKERDLEKAMNSQLTKVLLELGQYFAFLGRQYRVTLAENEYFYDLLFYHTKLKRYIVIELKIGEFKPEYVGKMDFYLTIADEQLRDKNDEKSIGLILCKTKNGLIAEYALRDAKKAIGISEYKTNELLPENIEGELPSIKEIEQTMEKELKALQAPMQDRMTRLMQKLAMLNKEEVKTPITFDHLCVLFDKSILPLFTYLLDKFREFGHFFISTNHYWVFENNIINLRELESLWKTENQLKAQREVYFYYGLKGLKMAGVDTFDVTVQISIYLDQYYYGIRLFNHDHHQPFLKKLYQQDLNIEEMQQAWNIICKTLMDEIEGHIERISHQQINAAAIPPM